MNRPAIAWLVKDGANDYYPDERFVRAQMTSRQPRAKRFAGRVDAERVAEGVTAGRVVRLVPRSAT